MTSLEEIKRLLAAATELFPAPWARDEYINQIHCAEDRGAVVADMRGWGHLIGTHGLDPDDAVKAQKANAQLIAKAPTVLAELIEQVERLRAALQRLASCEALEMPGVVSTEARARMEYASEALRSAGLLEESK